MPESLAPSGSGVAMPEGPQASLDEQQETPTKGVLPTGGWSSPEVAIGVGSDDESEEGEF